MALIIYVVYPRGERANGYGYPDQILVVREIPEGPEACYADEIECDFQNYTGLETIPVVRVVGGPRRPTIHVRVPGDEVEREAWMTAREAEGWDVVESANDPSIIWAVAGADGMTPADLERDGARLIARTHGAG
jgi:hypothetical protein